MVRIMAMEIEPHPIMMFQSMKFFPILMIIVVAILYGWYWSVAIGLHRRIPRELKLNLRRFKAFLIYLVVYNVLITLFFAVIFSFGALSGYETETGVMPMVLLFILPLHLFGMFCTFYCMYFVAKTIKTAEMQQEVNFGHYAGEFFLIWFYFIGIWIIQPKINRMIQPEEQQYFDH